MSTFYQLDFEKPLTVLERRVEQLQAHAQRLAKLSENGRGDAIADQSRSNPYVPSDAGEDQPLPSSLPATHKLIESLQAEHTAMLADLYKQLSPWNTVRVARHPKRPQSRDYIEMICKDFCELCGDRRFGDDPAMVTGFARIGSIKCLVVGHHKGRTTQEKIACHFGCAHPEGYRKALRTMQNAAKFGLPIVTFVDTPGAYPGIGAEQRGQAEAIAVNLREMSRLKTPIISIVIGEGGSGGALGIAVADRVAMLEFSWYSVISPEGCAAILWKQSNEQTNTAAAQALKLTARDNLELGIIDEIIREPLGGAHRDPKKAAAAIERWVVDQLQDLKTHKADMLPQRRYERFRRLGAIAGDLPQAVA